MYCGPPTSDSPTCPTFPSLPRYVDVDSGDGGTLRMHYLDEGPSDGEVVLLLHGEPSWSYLYRWMIPVLVDAGLRAVAIDLVGFGRSDKPSSRDDYTYQAHVDWTWAAIEAIGLADVTLVCQDWGGGLIGLRLVGEHPDRFARVVAANTMLPTGDHHPGEAFLAWQKFSQEVPTFPTGQIINGGTCLHCRPRRSRPTTHPSRTTATKPEPDSFRCSCRSVPMTRRRRPTAGLGRRWVASRDHSCRRFFPTRIRSPARLSRYCDRTFQARVDNHT